MNNNITMTLEKRDKDVERLDMMIREERDKYEKKCDELKQSVFIYYYFFFLFFYFFFFFFLLLFLLCIDKC